LADLAHSASTAADGNHPQQRWEVANDAARLALTNSSATPPLVKGGVCLQADGKIYDLLQVEPSIVWQLRGDATTLAAATAAVAAALSSAVSALEAEDDDIRVDFAAADATKAEASALTAHIDNAANAHAPIVSASVRAKVATITGTSGHLPTATVAHLYYRSAHKTAVAASGIYGVFWNGAVNAANGNAAWEQGPGAVCTIRAALLTNTNGTALDQTGANVFRVTWAGLQAGTRRIKDLTYATRTWADFVSAGGAVSVDTRTVTIPSGWSVEHDPIPGLSLAPGQRYYYQVEHGVPGASVGTPVECARVGPVPPSGANVGDVRFIGGASPSTAADTLNVADTPNWASPNITGAAQLTTSFAVGPIAILGTGLVGTKVIAIDGDSIADEVDDTLADADGAKNALSRAANLAGYSAVKVASYSSSMGNRLSYSGDAYRLGLLEYCDAVVSNHGHNDAASFGTANSMLAVVRPYNLRLRAAMKASGLKRVIRCSLLPDTDAGNTTPDGGFTLASAPYTIYLPYLARTGLYAGIPYDLALGDPDGWLDSYTAHGSASALWGSASYTSDGTHPSAVASALAATYLAPRLPAALGFEASPSSANALLNATNIANNTAALALARTVAWSWADAAARNAQSVTAADVHARGFQTDVALNFRLANHSPVRWVAEPDPAMAPSRSIQALIAGTFQAYGDSASVIAGTATGRTPSSASKSLALIRTGMVTAASLGAVAILRGSTAGRAPSAYGYRQEMRAMLGAVSANMRWSMGVMSAPANTDHSPTVELNCVMIGADAADTTTQLYWNDASGTCSQFDLGASFPAKTLNTGYKLHVYTLNGTSFGWWVVNIDSGAERSGILTTNIPAASLVSWSYCYYVSSGLDSGSVALDVADSTLWQMAA
jgi:hypothetical protein